MSKAAIAVCCAWAALSLASAAAPPAAQDDMVAIPGGRFIMGSDTGPADERPAHEVTLTAYAIDRFPVTNARYAEFLNRLSNEERLRRWYDVDDPDARIHRVGGRWVADRRYEDHPVVEVSWAGAVEFCSSQGKRLPTEAEWEKAARGADGRRYPWGNDQPDATRAQFAAGYDETRPVHAFPAGASPYGVQDLAGNAWEWVSSAYRPYPYRGDDGREDLRGDTTRATRGGGHDSSAAEITATQRGRTLSRNPRAGHHNIGFRCAR